MPHVASHNIWLINIYIYIYIYTLSGELKNILTVFFFVLGIDINLPSIVRHPFWSSWEYGVSIHCHYFQVHSDSMFLCLISKSNHHHHHHHHVLLAQISLTLSCYSSLSSIALGRSSRLNPVSVQSCCR